MKVLKDLTIIIVTYNTPKKIILDCLRSINNNEVNILIIENSNNFLHKDEIQSEFSNVDIICTGENLGYGKGNNFGIKHTTSKFALILNPDVTCDKDFFRNISSLIEEVEDFSIIGCQYLYDKVFMPAGFFNDKKNTEFKVNFKNDKIDELSKVDWVTGCSMLINLKKFQNKKIFDENFFLYFEEFDLCKSLIKRGENVYSSKKLKIHHLGFKSSVDETSNNEGNINILREWHWMWSTFYFYKKNFNYFYAFKKVIGKLIKAFFKIIFYSIIFNQKEKEKYKYRFLGIYNALLGRPSTFRGFLK